jgi:MFS family permease
LHYTAPRRAPCTTTLFTRPRAAAARKQVKPGQPPPRQLPRHQHKKAPARRLGMPDPSLSTGTLALFALVGASWGAVLLAWLCQRLTGCPPPPQTPPVLTASPVERDPLLPKGDGSEPQRIPGLDEANGFLFFCAILASIGMGLQSFNGNFTAVSLALDCTHPGMATALNCQLKISEQMVSVYAAVPALASIPGAFIGGAFVDRVGRKRIMLLACVPFVAGWLLTALAPTPPSDDTHQLDSTGHVTLSSQTFLLLFAGRVLLGFGGGLSIPGIGPWITESAPSDLRGAFATLFQVLAVSGIAVMYVFGLLLRWRGIAISGAIMCTVYILLLTALPESPRWLLARGREAEALAALRQLRTPASDVDAALSEMKAEHDAEQLAAKGAGVAALLRTPATRKAMLISMGLMTLQNLSVLFFSAKPGFFRFLPQAQTEHPFLIRFLQDQSAWDHFHFLLNTRERVLQYRE